MKHSAIRTAARAYVRAEYPCVFCDLDLDLPAAVVGRVPGGWLVRVGLADTGYYASVVVLRRAAARRPVAAELAVGLDLLHHGRRLRWVGASADGDSLLRVPLVLCTVLGLPFAPLALPVPLGWGAAPAARLDPVA